MKKNKFQSIGKNVIDCEIKALKKLRSSIGNTFDETVKTILNCKNGKIIISGVGKSGIIAKKWAATFSSTGTASFFLDASNASHGDMGQITSNDIVILISLSGETNELKNMKFNNNAKTVTRKNPETFSKASYKFGTINNPHPPYPLIARKKGWEGKLLLNVKINADGTVKDIKIEQSSGYKILDDISKKTLKKWSFIPARLGKKNTEDNLKIPVRFVLKD